LRAGTIILSLYVLVAGARGLLADSKVSGPPVRDAAPASARAKNAVDPNIKLQALWDGRQSVDFQAADYPRMVRANSAAFLRDDEYVLGLTVNGESRAYPTRFLAWHHIVNDAVGTPEHGGKAFVTVTY
jgi:Protein of unknown function (DUF3179).